MTEQQLLKELIDFVELSELYPDFIDWIRDERDGYKQEEVDEAFKAFKDKT